jgi:hypothetical protein
MIERAFIKQEILINVKGIQKSKGVAGERKD